MSSEVLVPEVVFEETPRQREFAAAVFSGKYHYLAFGGGIRSGKTYILFATLFALCRIFPGSRWAIVRKDLPTLRRNTIPSFNKLRPRSFVGEINQGTWTATCANGSEIVFFSESLDVDPDLDRWKGLEVNGFALEEANELAKASFNKAIERAGSWIIPGARTQPDPLVLLTFNPSPNWVKRTFYDPWKAGSLDVPYYYLPATIADNPHLPDQYVDSLENLPESEYKRFVQGDWDSMSGMALPELRAEHHITPAFDPPKHWTRFMAFDWGFKHPFSVGLYTVSQDGVVYKMDTITGRQMSDPEILDYVAGALEARGYDFADFKYTVAGGDCWAKPQARVAIPIDSTAETFARGGWGLVRAADGPGSRVATLSNMRRYLAGKEQSRFKLMDTPGNRECFEQLQSIQMDPDKGEDALKQDADINGEGGDDCYDECRYGLGSRPLPAVLQPGVLHKQEDRATPYDYTRKRMAPKADPKRELLDEPVRRTPGYRMPRMGR